MRQSSSRLIAVGERFGRLTVIGPCITGKWNIPVLPVRCDCGIERTVRGIALLSGHTQSCGCLHKERASKALSKTLYKHGDSLGGEYRQLYDLWKNLKKRCDSPKYREFHLYGGRGISYYPSWKDYDKFKEWAVSAGFKTGLTIERKNVDGNYTPENCIFVYASDQAQNRRKKSRFMEGRPTSSRYKGVSAYGLKWASYICRDGKQVSLGYHSSEHEAAYAYNVASERLFNQWAVRNDIPPDAISNEQQEAIRADVIRRLEDKGL